eukprot:15485831-Alexandrium_andersonii.AAC.1
MLDAMQSETDEGGYQSASITCVQEHAVVKSSVKPVCKAAMAKGCKAIIGDLDPLARGQRQ